MRNEAREYGVALLVGLAACSAKQEPKAVASTPQTCTNPVLIVDNATNEVARVYSGSSVIAEVAPGTHTIALRTRTRSPNTYRVSTSSVRSAGKVQVRESCEN